VLFFSHALTREAGRAVEEFTLIRTHTYHSVCPTLIALRGCDYSFNFQSAFERSAVHFMLVYSIQNAKCKTKMDGLDIDTAMTASRYRVLDDALNSFHAKHRQFNAGYKGDFLPELITEAAPCPSHYCDDSNPMHGRGGDRIIRDEDTISSHRTIGSWDAVCMSVGSHAGASLASGKSHEESLVDNRKFHEVSSAHSMNDDITIHSGSSSRAKVLELVATSFGGSTRSLASFSLPTSETALSDSTSKDHWMTNSRKEYPETSSFSMLDRIDNDAMATGANLATGTSGARVMPSPTAPSLHQCVPTNSSSLKPAGKKAPEAFKKIPISKSKKTKTKQEKQQGSENGRQIRFLINKFGSGNVVR
jgi:hypothetical protein